MFVDRVTIFVKGGDGGNGCLSFRREKYVPRGGPNGGDGGRGGHVIVRAAQGYTNLAHLSFQRHWKADRGEHGQGSDCTGRNADDQVIQVPPGTIVRDRDRKNVLRDMKKEGDSVVVARGGRGGFGNAFFKSSTNRAPRQHESGFPGEERWVNLELKVIADVGLIGLPNAGKSTLLSRISRAHPEIADYPFTTKYPNLGTVSAGLDHAFVVADIPGLIEGAHEGHGLGHEFLRHVERTRLLVHLVDAAPLDGSDPVANYRTIRQELELYSPALASRPELLVITKMDVTGAAEAADRLATELCRDSLRISAVTGQGIPALVHRIVALLDELPPTLDEEEDRATAAAEAALACDGGRDAASRMTLTSGVVFPCSGSSPTWATPGSSGVGSTIAGGSSRSSPLPVDDTTAWDAAWESSGGERLAGSSWAIASVNPPGGAIDSRNVPEGTRGRSGRLVPVGGRGAGPTRAGASRDRGRRSGRWRSRRRWRRGPQELPASSCSAARR